MMNEPRELKHFILTRFNLLLWRQDKGGKQVRSKAWIEHRCMLFERYCLPSVKSQTCQDFEWIILVDRTTPESFKERIAGYQRECKQMSVVYVEPEKGRYFSEIFKQEVGKRLFTNNNENENGNLVAPQLRVVTTYLDNDDALNVGFVEDVQKRALTVGCGTFIYYTDGYQYYTDYGYMMQIRYPRNHFVSVVEKDDVTTLKTIYGYGSHYYIDRIEGARIERVKNQPMWCEVVHEKNMENDAYFLGARMVRDKGLLVRAFGLQEEVRFGAGIYVGRFLPRYARTFVKRCRQFLFGRKW